MCDFRTNNIISKQPRTNQPPVGKQGPIRRRIPVVPNNKHLYNLCAVINSYTMT